MHVITEAEYTEAVEETAKQVFDPDSPDPDVREWSEEIVRRVNESESHSDERRELRNETRDRVWDQAFFHHPWQDQEKQIGFDSLPLSMHGMVLEHSEQSKWPDDYYAEKGDLDSARPEKSTADASAAVWASDVASAVFEDIRDHMKDD
jgi:hypothetical protein